MKLGKILIIDDQIDIQTQMKDALEDVNYAVFCASDAQSAIELFQKDSFDLVFMDIWLGDGQDGISLLKQFKDDGILTPIIMMSGHADHNDVVKAFKLGAVDFLRKPFLDVASIVRETLQKKSQPNENINSIEFNKTIKEARLLFEKNYFNFHLKKNQYNVAKVAEIAGLERTTLYRKLKDLGIHK